MKTVGVIVTDGDGNPIIQRVQVDETYGDLGQWLALFPGFAAEFGAAKAKIAELEARIACLEDVPHVDV